MMNILQLARRAPLLALLLTVFSAQAAPTGLLNDTGQTQCYDASNLAHVCDAATTGDAGVRPRQDGRFGRDVASPTKVGGGAAGFDFTKVCMDGTLNCAGAADTSASPASTAWACTKDNVTNLIWSLQSGNGDWTTYAQSTLPTATNAANRCQYNTGWRLPTRRELLSIVLNDGSNPAIDANYFPYTQNSSYWTSDTYASSTSLAWFVYFTNNVDRGGTNADSKSSAYSVRLVRSGP